MTARPSKPRLLLFAFGDFAFNLYWQSIMLFLLFYYTEALSLPIAVAATTYMVASIWDGIANFVAGLLVDREHDRFRYGPLLAAGAVPLGLSFVITYFPPPLSGAWAVGIVFVAHLLFRTFYAAVNVPYLAMTARISADPGDRAFVAGMRMMFGTAAAVIVALGTVPLGRRATVNTVNGSGASPNLILKSGDASPGTTPSGLGSRSEARGSKRRFQPVARGRQRPGWAGGGRSLTGGGVAGPGLAVGATGGAAAPGLGASSGAGAATPLQPISQAS